MMGRSTRWNGTTRSRTAVLVAFLFLGNLSIASAWGSQRFFFGVMGQIAHPGVYELPTAKPKLASIIGRAGGLTDSASRTIRVVRDGRVAFQTYYTPRLTLTLLPGDLLLVDGGRANYRRGIDDAVRLAGQIDTRASQSRTAASSPIEVAFVGLIDRPVVLRLRTRDATVGRVVQLLKQPTAVVQTMRLISPTQSRFQNRSAPLTSQTPLHSGTVLIFSQANLDLTTIPPLPTPMRPAKPSSTPPAVERSTSENSGSRVGRRAKISQDGKRKNQHAHPISQTGVITASGEQPATIPEHHEPADLPMRHSPMRHSAATFSKRHVPHRLSQIAPPHSASLRDEAELFSEKPVSNPNAMDVTPIMTTGPKTGVAPEPNRSGSSESVLLFVLSSGILAVGIASMLLISMARTGMKTTSRQTNRKQHKPSSRIDDGHALEALIRNEIVLYEEEIELPKELTLHGRSTGLRKLRIDVGREQLRGPHFSVPATMSSTASATADKVSTTDKTANTTDTTPPPAGLRVDPPQKAAKKTSRVETVRRRRGPLGQPQRKSAQRDLLDRVLSTVNKVTDE